MMYSVNQSAIKLAFALCLFISAFSAAQEKAKAEKVGVFSFETEEIDYGTIEHNANGTRVFKFINTGEAPIVISNAKGSCGCTVPTYSKNVIAPGERGEVEVKYATNRVGKFTKTITLTSNASEPNKTLRIRGEVLPEATDNKPKS